MAGLGTTFWHAPIPACMTAMPAGGACQALALPVNLGRFGNSLAIWLGIRPAELFLYIFLPPMLLDAAMRIDFFLFRKVRSVQVSFASHNCLRMTGHVCMYSRLHEVIHPATQHQ